MKKEQIKTILTLLIIIFSIVGIFDASYISYEKITGQIPACRPGFDCGKVLNSPWSSIGPIPLSVYGLGYYLTILIISSMTLLERDIRPISKKILSKFDHHFFQRLKQITNIQLIGYLTTFGFIFSIYLISLMAFVIQGWCMYCLISAFSCIMLFILSLLLTKVDHE